MDRVGLGGWRSERALLVSWVDSDVGLEEVVVVGLVGIATATAADVVLGEVVVVVVAGAAAAGSRGVRVGVGEGSGKMAVAVANGVVVEMERPSSSCSTT